MTIREAIRTISWDDLRPLIFPSFILFIEIVMCIAVIAKGPHL